MIRDSLSRHPLCYWPVTRNLPPRHPRRDESPLDLKDPSQTPLKGDGCMAAKMLAFDSEARKSLLIGVEKLATKLSVAGGSRDKIHLCQHQKNVPARQPNERERP